MPALGPFAMCLESILYGANESKKKQRVGEKGGGQVVVDAPQENITLWRGMRLRNHEIANYMRLMQQQTLASSMEPDGMQSLNGGGYMNLMGFASVTKKLPIALQNAMRPVPGFSDDDSMPVIM